MKLMLSLALMVLAWLAGGCAPLVPPPFPPEMLKDVSPALDFETVRRNPDDHKGEVILLGGEIVGVTPMPDGQVQIEVSQSPLDPEGVPMHRRGSGRFLLLAQGPLDPEKIVPRRRLTVVGEILGPKRQKLAGSDYPYVLLRAKALRFWPPAGEKPLHPIYYYPWEVTPRIGGR